MHWSWQGVAAVILAATLGGGYAAVLVVSAIQGNPVDSASLAALTNLGGILAGALAGWLGGAASKREPPHRDNDPDT